MNKISLDGEIIRDIKVLGTNIDNPVARFTIAASRMFVKSGKSAQRTDYIDCVAFGDEAKTLVSNYKKGDYIKVEAFIRNMSYTDKNKKKIYVNDIVIEEIKCLTDEKNQ